jgi:hypothetical protein
MKENFLLNKIINIIIFYCLTFLPATSSYAMHEDKVDNEFKNTGIRTLNSANKANLSHNIKLELLSENKLKAKQKNIIKFKLHNITGNHPLSDNLLDSIHHQKIHIYAANSDYSDLQHLYPKATDEVGEYEFSFTPLKSEGYRIWASMKLTSAETEEYVTFDLGRQNNFDAKTSKEKYHYKNKKYNFNLSFLAPLEVNKISKGLIRITDNKGKTVDYLEPFMENFSNIVGFYPNSNQMLHIHPGAGGEPKSESSRAGPLVEFEINPENKGLLKLFFEVKIKSTNYLIPFDIIIK